MNDYRILAIGGGTGLSALVKALDLIIPDFSVIVTTTDNGGSSGKLKEKYDIIAVGDLRKIIDSLANNEVLEDRYEGHALGNLFLLSLYKKFLDWNEATKKYAEFLDVNKEILPLYLHKTDLVAYYDDYKIIGEKLIDDIGRKPKKIDIYPKINVNPKAIEAADQADIVLIAPGSFYTSVMPHLIDENYRKKLDEKYVIYISNLRHEKPTKGFKLSDYLEELNKYIHIDQIIHSSTSEIENDVNAYEFYLSENNLHDPYLLSRALVEVFEKDYKYSIYRPLCDLETLR